MTKITKRQKKEKGVRQSQQFSGTNRSERREKARENRGTSQVVKDEQGKNTLAKPVQAKNSFQKEIFQAMKTKQVVVISSPAGTGKTFITVSEISDRIKKGTSGKVLISRPAVGMGPTLGLLKGGMIEKYSPYLAPITEVIKERYGKGFYECQLGNENIEMLPLEYIRGRNITGTLILDEAQNCTPDEVYTVLTRLCEGGVLIMMGDPTQNDLRGQNGLDWFEGFVKEFGMEEEVAFITTNSDDIVRGGLCKKIVKGQESRKAKGE